MTIDSERSQRELLAVISTANPHRISEAADRWERLSRIAGQVAAYVRERLDLLTDPNGGWTGPASEAYKARVVRDLIAPIGQFADNAAYIGAELRRLSSQVGFAVGAALENPVPWDEETNWRVEQKKVDRGWFSYVDEFFTGADEAWEDAQSNAPYQIKTGPGRVLKEVTKPDWQTTVAVVGSPPVPQVYGASGVPVTSDVNRFDRLMEYQGMNDPQRQRLSTRVENVNRTMSEILPQADDGSVGGAPERTFDQLGATGGTNTDVGNHDFTTGSGSGRTGTGSTGTSGTTGTTGTGMLGSTGSLGSGSTGAGSTGTGTSGTGSTGDLAGIRSSGGPALGTGASGTGSLGSGSLGSGSLGTGSVGTGSVGTSGSGGISGIQLASSAGRTGGAGAGGGFGGGPRVGTGAAGMGMMPPMAAGAGGGGSRSNRTNRTIGAGSLGGSSGSGFGGTAGQTGTVGSLGTSATGSNASFSMGQAGRGTVNAGSVGPVGNAQVNVGGQGGQGMGMAPMAGRGGTGQRQGEDPDSEYEEMYLDEDRSVWSDDISAPPGHIR